MHFVIIIHVDVVVFETSIHYFMFVFFFLVDRAEPAFNGGGKRYTNKHIVYACVSNMRSINFDLGLYVF